MAAWADSFLAAFEAEERQAREKAEKEAADKEAKRLVVRTAEKVRAPPRCWGSLAVAWEGAVCVRWRVVVGVCLEADAFAKQASRQRASDRPLPASAN